MKRWAPVLTLAILMACSKTPQSRSITLPPAFGQDWKLASTSDVPDGETPADVKRLGMRTAVRGYYKGQSPVTITVFQMTSGSGAFELQQRWRSEEGKLAFHRGDLFILIESPAMDIHGLTSVAEAFEEALDTPG